MGRARRCGLRKITPKFVNCEEGKYEFYRNHRGLGTYRCLVGTGVRTKAISYWLNLTIAQGIGVSAAMYGGTGIYGEVLGCVTPASTRWMVNRDVKRRGKGHGGVGCIGASLPVFSKPVYPFEITLPFYQHKPAHSFDITYFSKLWSKAQSRRLAFEAYRDLVIFADRRAHG